MFNFKCQKRMSSPTANAKGGVGAIEKLQPGLATGQIRTQGETLANRCVENLSRLCVRLSICASRQGVSKSC